MPFRSRFEQKVAACIPETHPNQDFRAVQFYAKKQRYLPKKGRHGQPPGGSWKGPQRYLVLPNGLLSTVHSSPEARGAEGISGVSRIV